MRHRRGDKLLNWGFATALTLHAAALACAAVLPVEVTKDEFGEIRVFDVAAAEVVVPVDLVEWPAVESVEPVVTVAEVAEPEALPVEPERRPLPHEEPAVKSPAPKPTVATAPSKPAPRPETTVMEQLPRPKPIAVAERPGGGGGGGGGFVDPGTPSPNGDVGGAPRGGTPLGSVAGSGSGSGAGTGPGDGGGSGGGSGGGVGAGQGTGIGPGSGSGIGGGHGDGENDPGFVSRVADRREPMVVSKGSLEYPPAAVADGAEGTVELKVLVSEAGTVTEATVVGSSRDRRLDAAAVEFVRGWRYKPAVQDGKPRSVHTRASVRFKLK